MCSGSVAGMLGSAVCHFQAGLIKSLMHAPPNPSPSRGDTPHRHTHQKPCVEHSSHHQSGSLNNFVQQNTYSLTPEVLGDNPPWVSHVSICPVNTGIGCLCFRLSFQGCWCSEQLQKTDLVSPQKQRAGFFIVQYNSANISSGAKCSFARSSL